MVRLFSVRGAILLVGLGFLTLTVVLPSPIRACDKSFRVYNETNTAIEKLYVSPTSARKWEDDVLGDNTLDSGKSTVIDMSRDTRDLKLYDVKAVFSNGAVITGGQIPVCKAERVYIHASGVTYGT